MEKKRSKIFGKPTDNAFRQQQLRAWQPVLRPSVFIPGLFIIGVLFLPIGGLLYWNSGKLQEIMIDYSACSSYNRPVYLSPEMYRYRFESSPKYDINDAHPVFSPEPPTFYSIDTNQFLVDDANPTYRNPNQITIKQCIIDFSVPTTIQGPVYMFYRIKDFYQNHNRYIKSLDAGQLLGTASDASTVSSNCDPFAINSADQKIIFPCGLVANSLFNDTFSNLTLINNGNNGPVDQVVTYNLTRKGLIWSTEYEKYGRTQYAIDQIVPPPNWASRYPGGQYTNEYPPPDLSTGMENLKVWMILAALPDFRKIWGKNDEPLSAGRWRILIDSNFNTTIFGGEKWLVISNSSPLGSRNFYLGLTYIGVGGFCFLLGIIFTLIHCIKPRKLEKYD
ncbi:unnamed protein product [Cunninghamella blakesleeana]